MKLVHRYVLTEFIKPFLAAVIAFLILAYISEFFRINGIKDKDFSFYFVLAYLFFQTPLWLVQILPVATLLASIFSAGSLSKTNELTAMFSAGLSPGAIFYPVFALSVGLSFASFFLNERVAPGANRRAEFYYRVRILKGEIPRLVKREFLLIPEKDDSYFYAESFDPATDLFENFYFVSFNDNSLKSSVFAKKAVLTKGNIRLETPFIRNISPAFAINESRPGSFDIKTFLEKSDFASETVKPEELGYRALREYITKAKQKGIPAVKEECQLYGKTALPFSSAIVFIFGLVIALRLKASRFISFSISLVVSFIYWGIMSVGLALGEKGVLSPFFAAWLGNVLIILLTGFASRLF